MSKLASYKGLGAPIFNDAEWLSTASTSIDLTVDQQGKLLIFDAGIRQINLPTPEEGMQYFVMASTGGVSTATKVLSSGNYDILVAATTGKGCAAESTVETGIIMHFFAINDYRWVANRLGASTLAITSTST